MSALAQLVSPDDTFNHALVENVHPPSWVNPTPRGRYNLVVLGAGTAGLVSAAGAAALGARVALVEKHLMGGDCLNYGCVPSKAVIRSARAAHALREAPEFGIRLNAAPTVSFADAMERMRRLRAEISSHDSAARFSGLGADVFLGTARFVGTNTVEVDGKRLEFSKAIIATGARPASPPIPGLTETGFLTNETVFSLTEAPYRLVVIGSGPIGCELAQAFRRLGSEVTILTRGSQLLPREDPEAATVLTAQFRQEDIRLISGARILRAERRDGTKVLTFDLGKGEETVAADEILVAIGRAPNVEGLNLEAAKVAYDKAGVKVDEQLRTTNRDIYAAGDVCWRYKFTHAAEAMARIALQNALFFGRKKVSDLVIPWSTYTDPEIAHVGWTEQEARQRAYRVATFTLGLREVDRGLLDGETQGFARVHVNARNGKILGATLVSPHAGESIGEIVLAMNQGLGLGTLSGVIHPYPTQAEILKRLGDAYMRSRFKPWMRRLLETFFDWRR